MDQVFIDLIDKIGEEEKQLVGVEFQSLSGQTIDDIYDPDQNDSNYQPSATEKYKDQQDEEYEYVPSRDPALYHNQDVNADELVSLERELDESLSLYQDKPSNEVSSSIESNKSRSDGTPELNELDKHDDVEMNDDDDVDDDSYKHSEQNSKEHFEITPYTGESQQDYFGTVDKTPIDHTDELSVMSIGNEFYREYRVSNSNFKYVAAHTTFMKQQNGANMMQTYFEIEASLLTLQYGFCKGLELFGDKGYKRTRQKSGWKELHQGVTRSQSHI